MSFEKFTLSPYGLKEANEKDLRHQYLRESLLAHSSRKKSMKTKCMMNIDSLRATKIKEALGRSQKDILSYA
jgi:hypothetical protein